MRVSSLLLVFFAGACGVDTQESETTPEAAAGEYCAINCPLGSGTYVASRTCVSSQMCSGGCLAYGWNRVSCQIPSGPSYWECSNRSPAGGIKSAQGCSATGYHVKQRANLPQTQCGPPITGGSNANLCERTPATGNFKQCASSCPAGYVVVGRAATTLCAGSGVTPRTPNQVTCAPQPTGPTYTECRKLLPAVPGASSLQPTGCGNGYHVKSRQNVSWCGPSVFGGTNSNVCERTPASGVYTKCGTTCKGGLVVGRYLNGTCSGPNITPQTVNQVACAPKPALATGPATYEHCGAGCEPGYHPSAKGNLGKCGPPKTGGTNSITCEKTPTSGASYNTCSAFCSGAAYVDRRFERGHCGPPRVTFAVANGSVCVLPGGRQSLQSCSRCPPGYRSTRKINLPKCGQSKTVGGNADWCERI